MRRRIKPTEPGARTVTQAATLEEEDPKLKASLKKLKAKLSNLSETI